MIRRLLIANRGEIAVRIIKTCRILGITSVQVYSEADANSLAVRMADEAIAIGPAPAAESYLRVDKILAAAREAGVCAIHPGFGFLSENADFAEQVAAAGFLFIGPPASAIRAMGSKSAAKFRMKEAGVPILPGYHGEQQDEKFLVEQAEKIGYPLLIKAVAGGGGKGMRAVYQPDEFLEALASCQREAEKSFSDRRVLIERLLIQPRHIEIQVFADRLGNVVHLFERDCSIQRRHQKVLEEAPAPHLPPEFRAQMGEAAVKAAKAIDYVGAGTVEFLVDASKPWSDQAFYFMEMNTRLQVEHPVTEMIVGEDLVGWQIKVAEGQSLPKKQEELRINGHAIEVRLYAEDPARDFLPQTGRLAFLSFGSDHLHTRIDQGVETGDEVSPFYDPMIAKLIAWGEDRTIAVRRLGQLLAQTEIAGLVTNRDFLARLVGSPAFGQAQLDTNFINDHRHDLFPTSGPSQNDILVLAVVAELLSNPKENPQGDPYSPWGIRTGWRLNDEGREQQTYVIDGQFVPVLVHYHEQGWTFDFSGQSVRVLTATKTSDGQLHIRLLARDLRGRVVAIDQERVVITATDTVRIRRFDLLRETETAGPSKGQVVAPMPGKIIKLLVTGDQEVRQNQPLLILEAMKMEHTMTAPRDGRIEKLKWTEGEQVKEGQLLVSYVEAD